MFQFASTKSFNSNNIAKVTKIRVLKTKLNYTKTSINQLGYTSFDSSKSLALHSNTFIEKHAKLHSIIEEKAKVIQMKKPSNQRLFCASRLILQTTSRPRQENQGLITNTLFGSKNWGNLK
jgi:hypothetical protein